MSDRTTRETIERMREAAKDMETQPRSTYFFLGLTENRAKEFCQAMCVDYAPVNGEQLIGNYLLQIV